MIIWVITDTHFNHTKMCEYESRPVDFNRRIISKWQELVAPDDLVIHLGDVIIGKGSKMEAILAQVPGTKVLTLGNHDHEKPIWYMERGFALA